MAAARLYRITFLNQGQVYEVYAKRVSQGGLLGFIEVEGLVFGQKTRVVVDPDRGAAAARVRRREALLSSDALGRPRRRGREAGAEPHQRRAQGRQRRRLPRALLPAGPAATPSPDPDRGRPARAAGRGSTPSGRTPRCGRSRRATAARSRRGGPPRGAGFAGRSGTRRRGGGVPCASRAGSAPGGAPRACRARAAPPSSTRDAPRARVTATGDSPSCCASPCASRWPRLRPHGARLARARVRSSATSGWSAAGDGSAQRA